MRVIKTILGFTIFSISLTFCKKDDNKIDFLFKGKVVDYYTNNEVPNTRVYFGYRELDPYNPSIKVLDLYDTTSYKLKIYTDANGNFNSVLHIERGVYPVFIYNTDYISVDTLMVNTDINKELLTKVKHFKPITIKLVNDSKKSDKISIWIDSDSKISRHYFLKATDTVITYEESIPETNLSVHYNAYQNEKILSDTTVTVTISKDLKDSLTIIY